MDNSMMSVAPDDEVRNPPMVLTTLPTLARIAQFTESTACPADPKNAGASSPAMFESIGSLTTLPVMPGNTFPFGLPTAPAQAE